MALVRIVGQDLLLNRQVRQETEAVNALRSDAIFVDLERAPEELAKVIPIKITSIFKLQQQPRRSNASRACQSLRTTKRRIKFWSSGRVANCPRS